MLRGRDIVVLSSLDYMAHWTSKQQIMHRWLPPTHPLRGRAGHHGGAFQVPEAGSAGPAVPPTLRRAEFDLWTLTPPPVLPFGNVRPEINRVNQRIIASYIRWALSRLGFHDYILWSYLPATVSILPHLDPAALVYHCVDEHSAFPGFVTPEVVWRYDQELCGLADLVVCTADNLRAARAGFNPHTYHVPNAGDVAHFKQALDPALPLPSDAARHPAPRLGVIGVQDERLDVQAVKAIAQADPTWNVLIIGPFAREDVDEATCVHFQCAPFGAKAGGGTPGLREVAGCGPHPLQDGELTRNIFRSSVRVPCGWGAGGGERAAEWSGIRVRSISRGSLGLPGCHPPRAGRGLSGRSGPRGVAGRAE